MNENQENNLNGVTPEVSNTEPVEPAVTSELAAPAETPAPVVEPTPVQPVQPVVAPSPNVAPAPEVKKKGMNPIILVLLILAIIGGVVYGLHTYTDILPVGKKASGNDTTTTTTEATTTAVASNEKTLTIKDEINEYYVSTLILKNNKIYGIFNDENNAKSKDDSIDVDGKKAYLLQANVYDMFLVEFGQSGLHDLIYTDISKQAYKLNILSDKAIESTKIEGATNIVNAYTLSGNDAVDYVLVDSDKNIVTQDNYVYIDNKNNINTTKLKDGTIVKVVLKSKGTADTNGNVVDTYSVTIGSKQQGLDAEYTYNENVVDYNTLELIQFDICTNANGDYTVGYNNCFVD